MNNIIKDKKIQNDTTEEAVDLGLLQKKITPIVGLSDTPTETETDKEIPRRKFIKNRNENRRSPRGEKPRSEFNQKVLAVRRVTRVTAGGKRFNISIALIIGDGKGRVGLGTGKGLDTALALEKALRSAKRSMISVNLTKFMSIPHEIKAKYSSSIVMLNPAPKRGLIAGSAVRDVLQIAGIKDVSGKILSRSKNKLNIGRATIKALAGLSKIKTK